VYQNAPSPSDAKEAAVSWSTLAAASFLADAGNSVTLHVEEEENRSPDIRIAITASSHVAVEVKAPLPLQHRTIPLERSEARGIGKGS
jgi:hypothetical protein